MKKTRSSNIELLRIVAMFMIVLYHIVYHCVVVQLTNPASMGRTVIDTFNHPTFYKELLMLNSIQTFGIIGNAIFILISGYFMANRSKNEIDMGKISKKLLLELGFASLFLVCIPPIIHHLRPELFITMDTISRFNSASWFVGYYFVVQLCGFLFLNKFLTSLDYKKYLSFLITLFAFISLSWSGGLAEGLASGLRTLLTGLFLYSLGGFISRFDPFNNIRFYVFFLIGFIVYLLIWISSYNLTETNIEKYIRSASKTPFIQSIPGFANHSIVIIILAVCLFEIFRRVRLPQSRVISFLGKSTFMVYLIHDNGFFYEIWNLRDWITTLGNSPADFLFQIMKWGVYTFSVGVAAYALYEILFKALRKIQFLFVRNAKQI